MKVNHLIFVLILSLSACNKPDFNDLGGTSMISGITLLNDQYTNSNKYIPLSGITIYLRNASDTFTYLYSVKTDKSGFFVFNGINAGVSYRVDAAYDTVKVQYRGRLDFGPAHPASLAGRDSLILRIDTAVQNGIHVTVKDYLGGVIPSAKVWVFNSPASFENDTLAGSAFTMVCDENGVANRYDINPVNYYFRVKVYSGATVLVDEEKTNVKNTGINDVILNVRPIPRPGFGNGLRLPVKNEQGETVSNASVYFYKDYETYVQDSGRNQNSIFKLTSGTDGQVSTYIINPGNYFVWARKVVGTKDTISNHNHYQITVGNNIAIGNDIILK